MDRSSELFIEALKEHSRTGQAFDLASFEAFFHEENPRDVWSAWKSYDNLVHDQGWK